jgi:hypothetical protein
VGRACRRLPRVGYWLVGAAVAFSGAVTARLIADQLPASARVAVWLTGGVAIFLGLCILSLGSRAHEKSTAGTATQEGTTVETGNDRG